MTCPPGEPCEALHDYTNYKVSEYGPVSGEAAMMAEIFKRGPISCSLDAGPIEAYTGGVFYDNSTSCKCPNTNTALTHAHVAPPRKRKRTLTINSRRSHRPNKTQQGRSTIP